MPSKTSAGIVADLLVTVGGSVRSEKFGPLARLALRKAVDHAPFYNFREEVFQDLVGTPFVNNWDSRRYAIAGRGIIPLAPFKQHIPQNLLGYDRVQSYRPQWDQMEPGVDVDGSVNAAVECLNFQLPIPCDTQRAAWQLATTGPILGGTYTVSYNGHTTAAIDPILDNTTALVQAKLTAAVTGLTALGGSLSKGWNRGFQSILPGVALGPLVVTPTAIVGGVLQVNVLQPGLAVGALPVICRFWYFRTAQLPLLETTIVPLEDAYLDLAPKRFLHEMLASSQLAGDQANHAYQVQELDKQLMAIKRGRQQVRLNTALWRSYDGPTSSYTGRRGQVG